MIPKPAMVNILISIPITDRDLLRLLAGRRELSLNRLIGQALKAYIRMTRVDGAPAAEKEQTR